MWCNGSTFALGVKGAGSIPTILKRREKRKKKKKKMPQLDIVGYVSQIIWLITMFFVLYLILVGVGLPRIYKVLRYRKNKLINLREDILLYEKELYISDSSMKIWLLNVTRSIKILNDQLNKNVDNHMEVISNMKESNITRGSNIIYSNVIPESWELENYVSKKIDNIEILGDKSMLKRKVFKG